MKKFKLTILGTGALALMLGLNIRHAVNNYGIMDGKLHMEVLAQSNSSAEWGGWSNFWQGQGFYKDEREEKRPCPLTKSSSGNGSVSYGAGSISGSGASSQTNSNNRYEIICPYGNTNCRKVGC
ncbi:MAG: hypothetical protein LBL33_02390 [Tannerella sp.]|nr:hypothetical protein [Tannerella sp.]